MLLAPLDRLDRAARLHPLLPEVLAWCRAQPWTRLADGRHPILGDDLFVILESGTTWDRAARRFESHRRYIDVQLALAGGETMDWHPIDGLPVEDDFQSGGDIRFHASQGVRGTPLRVLPGLAAIFFPEDAHRPVLHLDGTTAAPYRKAVFKVAVDAAASR